MSFPFLELRREIMKIKWRQGPGNLPEAGIPIDRSLVVKQITFRQAENFNI
jgi:hypothetical protein